MIKFPATDVYDLADEYTTRQLDAMDARHMDYNVIRDAIRIAYINGYTKGISEATKKESLKVANSPPDL